MEDTLPTPVAETAESIVTCELLEAALRSKEGVRDIRVKSFSVSPGCKKGENFASIALSVKAVLQIDEEEVVNDFFIKLPLKGGFVNNWTQHKIDIFSKESLFYSDVVSAMLHLQTEKGLEPIGPSVPHHYYSVIDENNGIIILEDLAPRGYILPDHVTGLDEAHCRLVMKELAIFHALAYALKNKDPHNMKKFETVVEEVLFDPSFPVYWKTPLKRSLSLVKKLTTDQRVIAAAEKLGMMDISQLIKKQIKAVEPNAVICHGDLWSNNVLFKYEEINGVNKPVDVKLLDFQLLRYALPATDLSLFLYTSTTRTTRKRHLKNLIALYHYTFEEYLKRLDVNFPGFSLSVTEQHFKQVSLFGIVMACVYTLGACSSSEDLFHFSQLGGEEAGEYMAELVKQMFSNKERHHIVRERLIGGIEDAVEMGLL